MKKLFYILLIALGIATPLMGQTSTTTQDNVWIFNQKLTIFNDLYLGAIKVGDTNGLTLFSGSGTRGAITSVGGDAGKFLRADGTWQTVATTGGDWWTNAPDTAISFPTNSYPNTNAAIYSVDGTNWAWVEQNNVTDAEGYFSSDGAGNLSYSQGKTTTGTVKGMSAYQSSAQTIPNATIRTVTNLTESYDPQGWFTPTTGIFQPDEEGFYRIEVCVGLNTYARDKAASMWVYKNGSMHRRIAYLNQGQDNTTAWLTGTVTIQMNGSSDTASIRIEHNDGADVNTMTGVGTNYVQVFKEFAP